MRRFAFLAEEGDVESVKFIERQRDERRFQQLSEFLGQVAQPRGFAYKDVIQPFLVAEWLPAAGLPALYIECPLADVAYAMLGRGWLYPAAAGRGANAETGKAVAAGERLAAGDRPEAGERLAVGEPGEETLGALLSGLARARDRLAALPAARVRYDDLISDESHLHAALCSLYGAAGSNGAAANDLAAASDIADLPLPRYLDDEFRRRRDEVLARRETARYRDLAALAARV